MAYFSTTKKGEIQELREGISSTNIKTKKDSVKRVIGAMMAGTDVSSLLPAVLVNMQTTDLELKKLIYLYLVNYSKSEPELAIHAVNTFVKDTEDPNPLVRALALRTMGQIRIEQITEYMCEPLHRCLKDNDPYVKKTAVLGVAKMYDINAQLVEDEGFIEMLHDLLGDGNPMVVSNSVATLAEIQVSRPEQIVLEITSDVLQKLVSALSQASEWGQVHILDALALWYTPETSSEAERIAERVSLHLNHNNSAVVLSATKVIVKLTESIKDTAIVDKLMKKLTQPLVSLLSSFPEVRYVALRNLNLIVQRLPDLLVNEINIFFCKYNDPIYVKMEKLEILMLLVNEQNVSQVLNELKEYATEVDIDFVRKAVSAIGRCAILLPGAAGLCVDTLVHLVETSQVNFVIQEAIIVIKDVFRRYPNKYESIIGKLCAKLESLDEPEAKASMIWILGEYADRIENADKVLESYFLETFADEPPVVQMAILTASVKIFLAIPASQPMVQSVLKIATKKTDNPDLRDRGFIYWRLLASSKELAKSVLKAKKPPISAQKDLVSKDVLAELIPYLGTLSSVLHKVPEHVMTVHRPSNLANIPMPGGNAPEEEVTVGRTEEAPQQSLDDIKPSEALEAQQKDEEDLIDLGVFGLGSGSAPPVDSSGLVDLTMLASMMGAPAPAKQSAVDFNTLPQLTQHQSGVSIFGKLIQNNQKPALFLRFRNASNTPITNVDLRFNVNAFALKAQPANLAPYPVQPGQQRDVTIACDFDPAQLKVTGPDIQVGIQCDVGMIMFLLRGKVLSLIQHGTDVNFGKTKAATVKGRVASTVVNGSPGVNPVVQKLVGFGFVETNRMTRDGIEAVQLYGQVPPLNGHIVIEMMFKGGQAHCNSRSEPDYLAGMLGDELGQELP
ncbi:Adaptor protein complex 1/2 (AP-1/2), beta subunit [Blattamonas nauphoetae]|uniref:AP complex subunit beta n=1 Tax=Blattamonas nauphoetae TaxID=2049346 RepID=A0ABQ9XQV9_9EUKA|nr:Adaptor protein complex 1/2 (AP-1/2), beta subunit [Blattamonas nauphoetae]